MVKEIEANLCFAIFGKNLKIQNGRHFRGGEIFFKIAKNTMLKYLWVENFDKISLSHMVKEIEGNLCFAIFGKNSKIRHFWGGEIFLKIVKNTFLRYPVGRKFRRNPSISHGLGDRSKFVFCHFWQKFENSKWLPFLVRGKFFEFAKSTLLRYPVG